MKSALLIALLLFGASALAGDYFNRSFALAPEEACCYDSQYVAKSRLADAYYRAAYALCEEQGGSIATDYANNELIEVQDRFARNEDNLWVATGSAQVQCRFLKTRTVGGVRG